MVNIGRNDIWEVMFEENKILARMTQLNKKGIGKNMNNNVMKYLSEKKNKAVDTLKEKKDDATRYAEERINAVKEYIEKNGKKIKRSATALALAGLTTLSATTMGGCENINNIINPEEPYTFTEPYEKPTTRDEHEIEEKGITAEDVLAEFDNLAWEFNLRSYTHSMQNYNPDEWEEIVKDSKTSAQFVKITPTHDYKYEPFPFYGIKINPPFKNWFLHYLTQEQQDKEFEGVYPGMLYINEVTFGHAGENFFHVGMYKDQFQPLAEHLSSAKFLLTEDLIYNYWEDLIDSSKYDYLNSQGYAPFEITRETIENASEEELYLLYDLAKSIRAISLNAEYPNIPSRGGDSNDMENN